MRLFRHVFIVVALTACGQGSGSPSVGNSGISGEHTEGEQEAYLDSLRRDAARRQEELRMRILDEPPFLIGTVLQVSSRELLVDGTRPNGSSPTNGDRFRVVLGHEGEVWRQDREPLLLDSLRPGDSVLLWAASESVAKFPVWPATLPVRAIMRLDQPLPRREPIARPAA